MGGDSGMLESSEQTILTLKLVIAIIIAENEGHGWFHYVLDLILIIIFVVII